MAKVKLYTLSTCPWCMKAKKFFNDQKIRIECVDYDLAGPKEQENILAEMHKYGGGNSFPFVIIDGEAVEGFDPERFAELCGLEK
jgi:glutaredoxin